LTRISFILCFSCCVLLADTSYELHLGGRSFDPLFDVGLDTGSWSIELPSDSKQLRIIQLHGATQDRYIDKLSNEGIQIVQYIHPFSYVVWADSFSIQRAEALPFVRWTGDFKPAYRVLPRWRDLLNKKVPVKILFYADGSRSEWLQDLSSIGESVSPPKELSSVFGIVSMQLDGEDFLAVAMVSEVYSIQPVPTDGGERSEVTSQINVGNVDGLGIAFPGYMSWLGSVGFDGSGVIIANVDSGIDQTHMDLNTQMLPCVGDTCGGSLSSSHGTHTAGIMAGDGRSGVTSAQGFLRGLGVAPGAQLIEQVSFSHSDPDGLFHLMAESFRNGASLSGNSWGPAGSPRGYDNDTLQVDLGVRDVDPLLPGHQPLTYVLSIMNGYGGTSSQGTPDEAKNIFTIGSTVAQATGGGQSGDINNLSNNSAHGPCLDGRLIPHMVAPGCSVDSTIPPNTYGYKCGTSMASPQVSGAVALFIEYYRDLFGITRPDPSPALIKAAFLPVALHLIGDLDADGGVMGQPFSSKYGWGRLDLPPVIAPDVDVLYVDQTHVFDDSGEVWTRDYAIPNTEEDVKIMLVWTDAPGHGLGGITPAWNNDLNLEVTVDGSVYKGNVIGADGFSTAGATFDDKNNTEGVFFHVPQGVSSFQVRILAANITSDGLPDFGDETDQDFALVLYNAEVPVITCAGVSVEITTPDPFLVCHETQFTLDLLDVTGGEAPYSYAWTPMDLLNDPADPQPLASILQDTLFNVLIADKNGCEGSAEIMVYAYQGVLSPYFPSWRMENFTPQVIDRNANGLFDIIDLIQLSEMCPVTP